ncbi:MAG: hypothetical protein JW993_11785 [Sedimentisphaerales bacterium]|nr:hypothetical protein [Sedimentisphaerales bacterium]
MRKAWLAALMAAALTTAASARPIQVRYWPATFVPQELVTIPVVMDVGFWIDIAVQGDAIKLQQVGARRFEGCVDVRVRCNFDIRLLYSIVPTGAVGGQFTCFPQYADIDLPGGDTTLCVRLDNADPSNVLGGRTNVNVANVTVEVIPRP